MTAAPWAYSTAKHEPLYFVQMYSVFVTSTNKIIYCALSKIHTFTFCTAQSACRGTHKFRFCHVSPEALLNGISKWWMYCRFSKKKRFCHVCARITIFHALYRLFLFPIAKTTTVTKSARKQAHLQAGSLHQSDFGGTHLPLA